MRESVERAGEAAGGGFAVVFADADEQGVELVEQGNIGLVAGVAQMAIRTVSTVSSWVYCGRRTRMACGSTTAMHADNAERSVERTKFSTK
jgi:hypothetical protein